jgi:hypothetical protein
VNKKETYYFLGNCLSIGDNPEFISRFKELSALEAVDWEGFVRLASVHLVTPLFFPKFRENNLLDYLPAELGSYLEEIYLLNLNRNKKLILQIDEINLELNYKDIYPIYLKGAGNLLDGLYSDPGERIMVDIDLLTSDEDFLKSVEILRSIGYNNPETTDVDTITCQHYPRMMRDGTVSGIEVHRLPVSVKYSKLLNYDIIAGEMRTPEGRPGCLVLSDKHKVMLSFIHSQLSHRGHKYGTASLRDVYDLWLLSKRINYADIHFPEPIISKASDYFYLMGRITGSEGIRTERKPGKFSVFLLKHDMNLTSETLYKINLVVIQLSAYFNAFVSIFTSRKIRTSVIKKLSSREWYAKHIKTWKRLIGI